MTSRDGFSIRITDTGEEIHFVTCTKNDAAREKVESGLVHRADLDRYYVVDTRSETDTA